jgi:hypothetical protein
LPTICSLLTTRARQSLSVARGDFAAAATATQGRIALFLISSFVFFFVVYCPSFADVSCRVFFAGGQVVENDPFGGRLILSDAVDIFDTLSQVALFPL